MWYIQTSVHSTLHCPKDPRPCRGSCQADVEVATEGTRLAIDGLHLVLLTGNVLTATVYTVQVQLLQQLLGT